MYRTVTVLYCIAFAVFILFSRSPDYFESDTTKGTLINPNTLDASVLKKHHLTVDDYPVVQYAEGTETYYYNGDDNYFLQNVKAESALRIIYNPGDPAESCIYRFWGYWLKADELLYSFGGYMLLLLVAILITGKNREPSDADENLQRQMKYN